MAQKKNQKSAAFTPRQILDQVRPHPFIDNALTDPEKIEKISFHVQKILETLGLDLKNESLSETPTRVARMYVNEIFSGLNPENFPKITVIENDMKYDQMILVRDIETLSVCEHHLQTIDGLATVAYIPSKKVIGLSKINRIVEYFSRRPQVQERLTKQIADCLVYVLGTQDVAVCITARHYCVAARGVADARSLTTTSDLRGNFKSRAETRNEFLTQCQLGGLSR